MPFSDDLARFGPDSVLTPSLDEAKSYCARLTASHYENFSVVTWLTPKELRPAFASIYAFCRWSDDLGDEVGDRRRSTELLGWWRGELKAMFAGEVRHPVFQALKPGGVFALIDHSGRPGTGTTESQTFHRIDEKVVREEIERAGFKFGGEASFLRNPADTRDWNDAPSAAADRRGTSDRFVYKFVKPAG